MNYIYIDIKGLRTFCLIILITSSFSCQKYLDEKPIKSQVIIGSVADAQAVMDKYDVINQNSPTLLEALADNYYFTTATYNTFNVTVQTNYVWDRNATNYNAWEQTYLTAVYSSNVVLDALSILKVPAGDYSSYQNVKGGALFVRAFAFYELAQLFCRPYTQSANSDPGIVLRLNSDINIRSTRSTVEQTYEQIISDLKEAVGLLPDAAIYPTRPCKIAAYGVLARVYLMMRDYSNAAQYANLYLNKMNTLMDYNSINSVSNPVFPFFNPEYVYYNRPVLYTSLYSVLGAKVDSTLYQSYDVDDLRKTLFFSENIDGTHAFRGSYEGQAGVFSSIPVDGICTDEMYLIRSECAARTGNKDAALIDLNTLLSKRWKSEKFVPLTATDAADALGKILTERRKELLFRSVRWSDIRRLNLEGANITLKRVINGTTYTLPPNDPRFVLLIPLEIIALTNLTQNPR